MLNKVILIGRLTADVELSQTPTGINYCRFTIAINRPFRKDAEKQADFIGVTAWRATAEFISKYFSKGSAIIVEGSLRNNDYTDKDGIKHYSMEVLASNVSFGGSSGKKSNTNNVIGQAEQNSNAIAQTVNEPIQIGNLNEFEEILSDGEVPF
jgi:single-strand DNA-binding protein